MIIEVSITIFLAIIFYIYLNKWPKLEKIEKPITEAEILNNKEIIKEATAPVSENEEVVQIVKDANEFFNQEEWDKAEKLYLKAASIDPKCIKAYSRLGVIYLKTEKDLEDAEAAFSQALNLDPDNGYILNNLGLVYHSMEKFDKAIECFEKSIKIDDAQASRYANLGIVYFAKRQYAKAEKCFKKAVSFDVDNHEYHEQLKEASEKKKSHRFLVK